MVLCDKCNEGYHIWCMEPPLLRVPKDSRHVHVIQVQIGLTTKVARIKIL